LSQSRRYGVKGRYLENNQLKTSYRFRPTFGISRLATSHLLALGLAFGAGVTVPAFVSPAQAQTAPTIGVLDEEALVDGDNKFQLAIAGFDARIKSLDSKLLSREFLTEDEAKTFDSLVGKEKPTPAEATQLDTVVKSGTAKRSEYDSIISNPNRSDADNKRYQELQQLMAKNRPGLEKSRNDLKNLLDIQLKTLRDEGDARVNSVITQVANDKKLSVVLRKSVVFWSAPTLDITAEVMKRLNGS
jgi:Skp family chaperone for outer membrane proteins